MDLDALAETARNRGLKLVRSRVRTPGKGDYGKVGVADADGKPLFGIDEKILTASPEQVRDFLKDLNSGDWGASLRQAGGRKTKAKPRSVEGDDPAPAARAAEPVAATDPVSKVRTARAADAQALVPLLQLLGYTIDLAGLKRRLRALGQRGDMPFVAIVGKRLVGLCGVQVSEMLQRKRPVGRITVLVVAEDMRGKSLGRMLVEAAEARFREAGCELVEVTSNDRHLAAHAFYRRIGFERTSTRFAKDLETDA